MIKELHKEKLIYKNKLSSLRSLMIDSWYTIPYYGKVNTNGDLIHPRNDKMTFCSNIFGNDQSGVLCFDFVADSILSFQHEIKERIIQNSFKIPMENGSFKILSGYLDPFQSYCAQLETMVSLQHQAVGTFERFLETAESNDYRSTGLEIQISGFPEILFLLDEFQEESIFLDEILAKHGLSFRNSTKFLTYDLYSSHFKSKVRNHALFFQSSNVEFKKYLQDFFSQYYHVGAMTSKKSFLSFFPMLTEKEYIWKRMNESSENNHSFAHLHKSLIPDYYPLLS